MKKMLSRTVTVGAKVISVITVLLLVSVFILGCSPSKDKFAIACSEDGGKVLEDTKTQPVTTVNGKGGVGVGVTSTTIRLCVVKGKVVDMEVW